MHCLPSLKAKGGEKNRCLLLIITDISHKIMNCLAKLNKNDYIGWIKAIRFFVIYWNTKTGSSLTRLDLDLIAASQENTV